MGPVAEVGEVGDEIRLGEEFLGGEVVEVEGGGEEGYELEGGLVGCGGEGKGGRGEEGRGGKDVVTSNSSSKRV